MTRFLLVVAGVHDTAAACDYLDGRVGPDDDVLAVPVAASGADRRDRDDALNVARARLGAVETVDPSGDPAGAVLAAAADAAVDEIVVGRPAGDGTDGLPADLLDAAAVPVVVVPDDRGEPD